MFRTLHPSAHFFGLATAVLMANGAVAITVLGQATPAELPTDCAAYASIPLPVEAEKAPVPKTPPTCASYRSYRGIGRPVNFSEARACAWQERLAQRGGQGEAANWVVAGSLILADIYINGSGVERNIPLAVRFACESEEGMATLALRDIAKLNSLPRVQGPFEFCDFAANTFTQNFCSGYASEIEDDRRSRYYSSLKSSMTPEQRAAFEKLFAAQKAYVAAHASEVYQGGTIHNMRTLRSMEILNDLFRTDVVRFERKQWPTLSSNQVATADPLLHREYGKKLQQLRTHTKKEIDDGEITADNLSGAEEKWEIYRDAWVVFARLRYPAAVAAIRAEVTLDRYRLLKTIS